MPETVTTGAIHTLADAYRDALENRNAAAVDRITRAWLDAQQRVSVEMAELLAKMEAARLAGVDITPAWLYQERRLANLTDLIQRTVQDWAPLAEQATQELSWQVLAQAERDARALAREAGEADLPGVTATFTDINPANMATLLGHLAPGGPLTDLLASLGGEMAEAAQRALLQGVILGKGIPWIARELAGALDIPRHRAETIARTESLRVYRETSRLTYQGSNVVGSWYWSAALDRRTCPGCVAMHGTEHPLTERLDGHPRCRCAMIPKTKTWAQLGLDPSLDEQFPQVPMETGEAWLRGQAPLVQRAVLGPLKHEAWTAGQIALADMVARTYSPRWGTMRRERSMREIREGRNANYSGE